MEKTQIEFVSHAYGKTTLLINYGESITGIGVHEIGDLLKEISESLHYKYCLGDSIFYLTPKQLEKLKLLTKKYKQ